MEMKSEINVKEVKEGKVEVKENELVMVKDKIKVRENSKQKYQTRMEIKWTQKK